MRVAILERGFSKNAVDVATALVVGLFVDEVRLRLKSFESHRLYLNAVLGLGSGASIAIIVLLSLAQLFSCVVITFPVLYNKVGTAVPSMALGTTLFSELVVYHGFFDTELVFKASFVAVSLFLVGLLRGDKKIRADALDTPLHGASIAAEAKLRRLCTVLHSALFGPPACLILMVRAVIYNRYWNLTGAAFEIQRTTFCTNVSLCAVILFAAGQDRSPKMYVYERFVDFLQDPRKESYKCVHKLIHGVTPNGKKKDL